MICCFCNVLTDWLARPFAEKPPSRSYSYSSFVTSSLGCVFLMRTCYQLIEIGQNLKYFLQSFWTKLLQYKKVKVLRSQFILLGILKTLKKHSRNCLTIQNNWRLSGNFWHNQEFFWIIKTLRTIRKISWLSRNFPDYPETFQVIWKLPSAISRVTGENFTDALKLSEWECQDATMVFVPLPLTSPLTHKDPWAIKN